MGIVKNIDSKQLHDLISQTEVELRVIDVREPREILSGHINGAETIPLATLPARMADFAIDETIVMVCRSGARSAQACGYLQQNGYEKVFNLSGGMMSWRANNLPCAETSGS